MAVAVARDDCRRRRDIRFDAEEKRPPFVVLHASADPRLCASFVARAYGRAEGGLIVAAYSKILT